MPPIDRHLAISLVDELTAIVEPVLATAANRGEVRAVLTALAAVSASGNRRPGPRRAVNLFPRRAERQPRPRRRVSSAEVAAPIGVLAIFPCAARSRIFTAQI